MVIKGISNQIALSPTPDVKLSVRVLLIYLPIPYLLTYLLTYYLFTLTSPTYLLSSVHPVS